MNFKPAAIDSIFKKAVRAQAPGAAVAVVQDGQLIYKNAWGLSSVENPLPLTPLSVFNTGSLAKQFTAFAIFQLQQRRKLNVEDEVRKYVPELPNYGRPLRIRHLLWHTSGLRCFTTLLWWGGVAQRDNFSRKQSIELVCRQKELNFKPGDEYLYGNSNYLLLSEIVERVSGKSMADFCSEIIFVPMGMRETHFRDKPSLPIKNLVSGHFAWDKNQRLVNRNLGSVPGVGRLMSHVEDLAKWDRFFSSPSKTMLPIHRSMLTQGWLDNGQKIRYGGGLMFQRYRGLNMIRHDGYSSGCRAEFCRFPDKGLAIACMTNDTELSPTWLSRQIADTLWGKELEPYSAMGPGLGTPAPARAKMSAKKLAQFEGLYRALDTGPFAEFQVKNGALHYRSMHNSIELAAESASSFQGVGAGRIYRFDFNERGGFIMTKQGRATSYERFKLQPKTADAKLERFVGRYASPELVSRMDLKIRDGKLWINDPVGFEWELQYIKSGHFYNYFRDIHFSKRGMTMEASDQWVRKLKWVKI